MDLTSSDAGNITLQKLQDMHVRLPLLPQQVLFTPWPWAALGVGLPKELIAEQREINRIQMGTLEIMFDRYMMPRTRRVQFRFPRSKKRRIRNKWAKQSRNFRYESVVWLVDKSKLMKLEYPRAKPLPLPPLV